MVRDISDFYLLPWPSSRMEEGARHQSPRRWGAEAVGRHLPKHCGGKKDSPKRSGSFQNPKGSCPQDAQVHLLLGTTSTLESLLRAPSIHSGAGFSREPHAWPPEQRRELSSGRRTPESLERGPQLRHKIVKLMRWFQMTP